MKRFFTFFFLFFSFAVFGQNLIPDPSAEDFVECPFSLGNIDTYLSAWQSYKGTPDYWHSCSTIMSLGWNNGAGYQEPRSGTGYLGGISYSTAFPLREYIGTELLEPMEIGETYFVSYYVSLAYKVSGGSRIASNNLGVLLMTENYFDLDEGGEVFNFSHLKVDTIISDTTNWVLVSGSVVADSAYTLVAFGNFYDDSQTIFEYPFAPDNVGDAYYYYDDFCVTINPNGCDEFVSTTNQNDGNQLSVWPNPVETHLNYSNDLNFSEIRIFNLQGRLVYSESAIFKNTGRLELNLEKGIYWIEFTSLNKRITKRFVVQ